MIRPGTRQWQTEEGRIRLFGLQAVLLGVFFAAIVAVASFLAHGQDAFRWRDRAAGTLGAAGQQFQYLPQRETVRAVIAPERKDPAQTHWGDAGDLPVSVAIIEAEYALDALQPHAAARRGERVFSHGFLPRGPPGVTL